MPNLSTSEQHCDSFDCDEVATHRADWPVPEWLRGKPGYEGTGRYCEECADRLRRGGDNTRPLTPLPVRQSESVRCDRCGGESNITVAVLRANNATRLVCAKCLNTPRGSA